MSMQIIAFLLGKKGKVAANEYERRGLCFTPRGTQIKTTVQTTVLEEVRVRQLRHAWHEKGMNEHISHSGHEG